jgi:hypothetical protein
MDSKWTLDSAKDGGGGYYVIHGQLPKGINGDFGYPVCDTMNRHHCISPEEDEANARLIATAPELLKALEGMLAYLRVFWPLEPLFSTYDDRQAMEIADAEAAIRKAKGE